MKTKVRLAAIIVILSIMSGLSYGQIKLDKAKINTSARSVERINLYPNPANNVLTIQNLTANTSIEFYNVNGQLVKTEFVTLNGDVSINVSDLIKGIYYIVFKDNRKKIRDVSYLKITK